MTITIIVKPRCATYELDAPRQEGERHEGLEGNQRQAPPGREGVKLTAAGPHVVIEATPERRLENEESVRRVPLVNQEALEAPERVPAGSLQGVTVQAWSNRLS
jgi:hypothetical protein